MTDFVITQKGDEMSEAVKKKGAYLDCYSCVYHSKLYDRRGRMTGHWCVLRNGRLHKRFRGDCKWIEERRSDE